MNVSENDNKVVSSPRKQTLADSTREDISSPSKKLKKQAVSIDAPVAVDAPTVVSQPEPLTDENSERFCMFPIRYQSIWEFYKKAEASFWTGEDIGVRWRVGIRAVADVTSVWTRN